MTAQILPIGPTAGDCQTIDERYDTSWNVEIVKQWRARWENWSQRDRDAAIQLVCTTNLLSSECPFPSELRAILKKLAKDGPHATAARDGMARIEERWEDNE